MSEGSVVAIVIACVSLAGQVVNCILHLRIKNAILESEKSTLASVRKEFVSKEVCVLARCMEAGQEDS